MKNQGFRRGRNLLLSCVSLCFVLLFLQLPLVSASTGISSPYILIGGQTGTWFTSAQTPQFYQMSMSSGNSVANLTNEIPTPNSGSIWTGASNSTQWLVSGFCCPTGSLHSPQIALFEQTSMNKVSFNASKINTKMTTWWGGDIFTASYGGKGNWLVAGLGSGCLPSFQPGCTSNQGGATGCGTTLCYNHMALGLFNGSNFIDLSGAKGLAAQQNDFILYASAWNGHYWLVGGGYLSNEILFRYNPSTNLFSFLTTPIEAATGEQGAITSIAWNGKTWMIGGMGFLASYDGKNFTSLTSSVNAALTAKDKLVYPNSVNKILWDSSTRTWVLGGGLPISLKGTGGRAWIASYKPGDIPPFKNVPAIPASSLSTSQSAVLALSYSGKLLVVGGYDTPSSNRATMFFYNNATSTITNMTGSLGDMGYVDWIGSR